MSKLLKNYGQAEPDMLYLEQLIKAKEDITMKRTLAICLLMAMVIALLPVQVFAETPQQVSVGENGEK